MSNAPNAGAREARVPLRWILPHILATTIGGCACQWLVNNDDAIYAWFPCPAHQQPAPATDALLTKEVVEKLEHARIAIQGFLDAGGLHFGFFGKELMDDLTIAAASTKTAAHYKAKVRDLENEIKRLHQASTTAKGQRADSEAWGRAMNDRREQAETERDRCKQRLREANGLLKSILYHDERGQGVGYAETMQQARAHLAKETPHDPQ